jgi:hypothetical protein
MGGAGTQIRLRKGNHSSEDGLYGILSSYLLAPFYLMKKSAKNANRLSSELVKVNFVLSRTNQTENYKF